MENDSALCTNDNPCPGKNTLYKLKPEEEFVFGMTPNNYSLYMCVCVLINAVSSVNRIMYCPLSSILNWCEPTKQP